MPELPEVETVKNALIPHLSGRMVTRVEIFTPKLREPLAPLAAANLEGRRITGVGRRGRYLIIGLDDGRKVLIHLGMTGVIRIERAEIPRRKHEHVFFHLDNGDVFRFECTRRFSVVKVIGESSPELDALGPEPLEEDFNAAYLFRRSRERKIPVKLFLMDNAVVTGIGNIYANETLFRCRIHPLHPAGSLKRGDFARLVEASVATLREAIEAGGSTIRDFRLVDGSEGHFAQQHQVYQRRGQPCPVCGRAIGHLMLGGRSTFFCPECQREPRRGKKTSHPVHEPYQRGCQNDGTRLSRLRREQ
ncbi:MAG: bifunctional DNA-formamidopyrimidine glycosylase/DNA-(apurinic or apyrimidinic site) lyase [Victivallaceae bacterium]